MVQSQYIAKAKFLGMLISSVAKVWLITNQYSLVYFAYIVVAESILILVLYLYYFSSLGFYRKHWKFRLDLVKSVFIDSWPIMLTTLSAILYTRIDQFMIHSMLSNSELGIYSAAIRLTESWLFIPMIIQSTFFPLIISAKEEGIEIYNRRLLILTGLTGVFSVLVGVIVSFGSDYIMVLLYGEAYSSGGSILSIKIWESVLASVATVSSVWAIIENLQRALVKILLLGLVTNAILNYFMIPYWGGDGAAYASLISGFATLAVFPMFDKRFRYIVALRIRTLLFINVLDVYKAIVIEVEDRKKAV
jgi:O-antigen/teichoic acid export membrane protein